MSLIDDDNYKANVKDFKAFIFLIKFCKKFRGLLAIALTLILSVSLARVWAAFYLGELIQKGLQEKISGSLFFYSTAIIGFEVYILFGTYIGRYVLGFAANGSIMEIRKALFSHLNVLPMTYFDKQPLGRIVTRLTYDVEGLEDFFSSTLARLLQATFTLVVVLTAMLFADFKMGLWIILAIIPAIVVTYVLREPVRHWNREFAKRNSAINAKLSEFLNGLPVIRSFGAEKWSENSFNSTVQHHLDAGITINILNAWSRPLILFLCYLPTLALIWFGGKEVVAGAMSLGLFVAFIRLSERFSRPIMELAQEIHVIQAAFTNAERVTQFLNAPAENSILGEDGSLIPAVLNGDVEFKNVRMEYEKDQPVLNGVSFHVKAAEKIGLAGRTGSGKTSTVALLARLYDFQSGEIFIDQIPIRQYSRNNLRARFGYVSQDVVIFKGSLRENLDFSGGLSDKDINHAISQTGLDRVMLSRKLKLDDRILDQGANLSHGERQLIALTRILLRNPALLILDEATANIDPEFEEIIHKAIDSLMQNRTCFIIAHRLDTLKSCHRILVFREGQIVEDGNHQTLMERKGYYHQLQQSGRSEEIGLQNP